MPPVSRRLRTPAAVPRAWRLLSWGSGMAGLIAAGSLLAADTPRSYIRYTYTLIGASAISGNGSSSTLTVQDVISGNAEMQPMANPMTKQLMWISANRGGRVPFQVEVNRVQQDLTAGGPISELNNSTEGSNHIQTWQAATNAASTNFGAILQLDSVRKTYSISLSLNRIPDRQLVHYRFTNNGQQTDRDMDLGALDYGNLSAHQFNATNLPLSANVEHISGHQLVVIPRPAGWKGSWDFSFDIRWELTGHLPPVELIVSSTDYPAWRPTANPGPTAGDPIKFIARLQKSDGEPPAVKVKRFEWTLVGTSREPGIAMNFPVDSDDKSYDLKLRPTKAQKVVGNDGQKITRDNPDGFSDIAYVDPYDWGGCSTLQVKAILEDGKVVVGHLSTGEENVLLPKRAKDSMIADIWKSNVPNAGADDADDETTDIGVPNAPGDGFTLYEEYRGFYENQKHIEGDPAKKDFFILNLVGIDANPGIDLFEDLSEFKVHSKVRMDEMDTRTRLMNGNRWDGAHRKDQHGVWIKTMDAYYVRDGANTEFSEADVAGRPGITLWIGIRARGDDDTLFAKATNLSATDAPFAYDRAVAHELFHSVGVDHHGPDNWSDTFHFYFADDPNNSTGKYVFLTGSHATFPSLKPAYLLDEKNGEDLATKMAPAMEAERARIKASNWDQYVAEGRDLISKSGPTPQYHIFTPEDYAQWRLNQDCGPRLDLTVGTENGLDSGDEVCVMRYTFAQLYRAHGIPDTFYLVTQGQTLGMNLCKTAAGTGRNAESNKPQSRFGHAQDGFGNCANQVCPNDAVPPRSLK